jgi:hypothetical protein
MWKFSIVLAVHVHFLSIIIEDDPRKFIYPWVLKCFSSFLPIILKIFIPGSFRISWLIVRFPMLRKCTASTVENFHTCQIGKMPLTRGTKNLCIDGLKLHDKHQEHLLCVKHWFKELEFIYLWVSKCSRSFLPIILKIFIPGSFRISWLIVRFPFFRFID